MPTEGKKTVNRLRDLAENLLTWFFTGMSGLANGNGYLRPFSGWSDVPVWPVFQLGQYSL
jgi:hypothetical protein